MEKNFRSNYTYSKAIKGPQKHGRQDGNIEMKLLFENALKYILEKCVFKVTKSVGYVIKG